MVSLVLLGFLAVLAALLCPLGVVSMISGDRLLRVQEVAQRLGVSARQCWKLLASGRLPQPVRLGRSVRWRESDISAFIAAGCPDLETFEAAGKGRAGK